MSSRWITPLQSAQRASTIHKPPASTAPTTATVVRKGASRPTKKSKNAERDSKIMELVTSGKAYSMIAKELNLNVNIVAGVVYRNRGKF